MAITPEQRLKAETLIYTVMDKLDKTKSNSEYYKQLFADLSDKQFEDLFKKEYPLKFHYRPFEIEPTINDMKRAADVIKLPLTEKVYLPHRYRNADGTPMTTKECPVVYIHIKKMKQFITKKNAMSTSISRRDMKTGRLIDFDKNGMTSDRELEAFITLGLKDTVDEFARYRADAMDSKNKMYNIINATGSVSNKDLPIDEEDSLAKNLMNVYLTGALIYTNILNKDYYLPHTLKNKNRIIQRV